MGGLVSVVALLACAVPEVAAPPELVRALQTRKLPPILVTRVGGAPYARDDQLARLVMPVTSRGRTVAKFRFADLYFKAIFTTVDELRALGFEASAHPQLWSARTSALAEQVQALDDAALGLHLTRLGAQEDVPALFALNRRQQMDVLVSRRTLLAARTGLPTALRSQSPSARALRDRFFTPDDDPTAPLVFELDILRAAARAEGVVVAGAPPEEVGETFREAELGLEMWLRRPHVDGPAVAHVDVVESVRLPGSGVLFDPHLRDYTLELTATDPVELAIRAAVRRLCRQALDRLPARASHP